MFHQVLDSRVDPGLYVCKKTGKGLLVNDDLTYFCGSLKIKSDKYVYFQYRNGNRVIQKYLGKKAPEYWLSDGSYYF